MLVVLEDRDIEILTAGRFVDQLGTLRYAIEHLDTDERRHNRSLAGATESNPAEQ